MIKDQSSVKTIYTTFGQWVKARRKERGLTQKALGLHVGYAEITVRQVEKDTYKLTRFMVERFTNFLAVESDDNNTLITHFAHKKLATTPTHAITATHHQFATPFIGRQTELEQISNLLQNPACRCISIVGVGGIGKTRLVARAIFGLANDLFPEIVFVNLTEATTTEQMARMIANAVEIGITPFRPPTEQLLLALATKNLLLILDNFEQLLPHSVGLLTAILAQAPGVKLLITSRERLQLNSEWSVRLYGLGMSNESPVDDAMNLFIHTAQRMNQLFAPTQSDEIRAICRLLQGIPLAIEMAASWTNVYSCAEILQIVTHKALDLTSRYQDVDTRHRSLQAVFDTSWERLSPIERQTLMRLAVFRRGFTLETAQKITSANSLTLAFLQEKMLIQPQNDNRMVLHEMIRQLATQKLMLDDSIYRHARLAHAEYFVQRLAPSANKIKYMSARDEILYITHELENIYVAWNTLLEYRRTDWFDLCWEGLWLFFNVNSRFREGEAWFHHTSETFATNAQNDSEHHIASFSRILVASLLLRQARISEAYAVITAPNMELMRTSTNPYEQYYFYFVLSYIFHAMGEKQASLENMETGLESLDKLPDNPYLAMIAEYQTGRVYHLLDNLERAYHHMNRCMALYKEYQIGWGLGLVLTEFGLISESMGQINEALAYYEAVLEAVTEWEEIWNYHRTQINIGRVKLLLGRQSQSIDLFLSTLLGLQNNPQIGLEIDCFVEVALVLQQFNETTLAIVLLEYCSTHPECFQTTRQRASDYLKKLQTDNPALPTLAQRNLFPATKQGVTALLLNRLAQIKQQVSK
jgi:tetratricopeptide (TPR) repeat protein/transcriptional regulator with XRE-family HTH domain